MATAPYDEMSHSNGGGVAVDPMFHWNTYFPQKLSLLQLVERGVAEAPAIVRAGSPNNNSGKSRKMRQRNTGRYKTQPITFDEIQEIDEADMLGGGQNTTATEGSTNESKGTKNTWLSTDNFVRSIDIDRLAPPTATNQLTADSPGESGASSEVVTPALSPSTSGEFNAISSYAALQMEYERRRRRSRKDRRHKKASIDEIPDA